MPEHSSVKQVQPLPCILGQPAALQRQIGSMTNPACSLASAACQEADLDAASCHDDACHEAAPELALWSTDAARQAQDVKHILHRAHADLRLVALDLQFLHVIPPLRVARR